MRPPLRIWYQEFMPPHVHMHVNVLMGHDRYNVHCAWATR